MKRTLTALLALLLVLACTGCGYSGLWQALASQKPSASPTEALTEAPTEAPAETPEAPEETPIATEEAAPTATPVPTEEAVPTAAPDYSAYLPQLGKLCDGPIFPEPAKYLVIKGESDIFYVYDNMGELVSNFHAVEDEYAWGWPGFFGPDGICENVRISTGESAGSFDIFDDMIISTAWDDGIYISRICDGDFNELFSFDGAGVSTVGLGGGVLHINGDYLLLNRRFDWESWNGWDSLKYESDIKVLGPDGSLKGTIDPTPFGHIVGSYAGRYIISGEYNGNDEYGYYDNLDYTLYDIDGSVVMRDVEPVWQSYFSIDSEMFEGQLMSASYLRDKDGNCYDPELRRIDELPEDANLNALRQRYGNLDLDGYEARCWGGGVYSGVKDAEGNWLFRIYSPELASDHDNESWDWDILGDNEYDFTDD